MGIITDLELDPSYEIAYNGFKICRVVADFRYVHSATGEQVVEDVKAKGAPLTRDFKLGQKLVKAFHDVDIKVVRA